jgi:protoheme IX farnesyltransferase
MQTHTVTTTNLIALTRLVRLPLSAMVALTALTGGLLAAPRAPFATIWALCWGVFLLSASSSVLNQVQERFTDGLMRRTCHRPLANGTLTPATGMTIGLLLGSGGLAVLATGTNPATTLLGLAALAWYLAVYTPLKRITSFAVIAGTPCGALPPLMGWLATGGDISTPQALSLALVMLLWQVPHYWLLALPDRADLRAAGFRVLPAGLSDRQMLAVSHRWILGLAMASLLLPLLEMVQTPLLQGLVVGLSLALVVSTSWVRYKALFIQRAARRLRYGLHLYLAMILTILLLEALLQRLVL